MNRAKPDNQLSEREATKRMDEALKRALNTPHKPHMPKKQKPARKRKAS